MLWLHSEKEGDSSGGIKKRHTGFWWVVCGHLNGVLFGGFFMCCFTVLHLVSLQLNCWCADISEILCPSCMYRTCLPSPSMMVSLLLFIQSLQSTLKMSSYYCHTHTFTHHFLYRTKDGSLGPFMGDLGFFLWSLFSQWLLLTSLTFLWTRKRNPRTSRVAWPPRQL